MHQAFNCYSVDFVVWSCDTILVNNVPKLPTIPRLVDQNANQLLQADENPGCSGAQLNVSIETDTANSSSQITREDIDCYIPEKDSLADLLGSELYPDVATDSLLPS